MAGARSLGSLTVDLIARIGGFEQGMDKAARSADKRMRQIEKRAKIMGAAVGAGLVAASAAVVSWTKDVVRLGTELENLSKLAKSSPQDFQRWAAGAKTVGIEQDKLADQLKDFNEKLGEFQQTGGGAMKDFFTQIAPKVGITADAFKNLSGPQGMQLYFDALQKANLSQSQMSFYLEAMASDTTALIPLLKNGGAGFKQWGDQAERLGAVMDDKTLQSIKAVRDQTYNLDQAMLGLKVQVAQAALPALQQFAELLGQESFRQGFENIVKGAAKAVSTLAQFATTTASVTQYLSEEIAARLHGTAIGDAARIEDRIGRLKETMDAVRALQEKGALGVPEFLNASELIPSDLLKKPETVLARLQKELDAEKNKLHITAQLQIDAGNLKDSVKPFQVPTVSPISLPVTGKKTAKPLDFLGEDQDQLRETIQRITDARKEFDAWSAQLAGPVAQANQRYAEDLAHLNELAKDGEVSTDRLTAAQAKLREEHENNIRALEAMQSPAEQALEYLKEQGKWLAANAEGQRQLTAAQMLGVDATRAQIDEAAKIIESNQKMAEANAYWDDLGRGVADTFTDIVTGAQSATDAIGGLLDNLYKQAVQFVANEAVQALLDSLKTDGSSGGSGTSGSGWAGLITNLAGAFGGGKAGGGGVSAGMFYEVNERGPELLSVRGRDYLMMGSQSGSITPNTQTRIGRGGTTINVAVQPTSTRRTAEQVAVEIARTQRIASARNG